MGKETRVEVRRKGISEKWAWNNKCGSPLHVCTFGGGKAVPDLLRGIELQKMARGL
jgi:hypothetical protein